MKGMGEAGVILAILQWRGLLALKALTSFYNIIHSPNVRGVKLTRKYHVRWLNAEA
jgi:hypothetical protein